MNTRLCSKVTCSHPAVATLTYSHEDRTAVLGQLTPVYEPHAYDLCEKHAKTLTAPQGWQLIRHVAVPRQESQNETTESNQEMPLNQIVKSYDVRGLVGSQLTPSVVSALAAAFVDEVGAAGRDVIVGHDMRDSSPEFADAFAEGAQARGANVVSIGLCSTDESYFASGFLDAPAAMFTASHNPASYNGIKFSRAGARGISIDTGLGAIRDRAQIYLDNGITEVAQPGTYRDLHVLVRYASYLRELVNLSSIRQLKVVVDAGNGMGGMTVPAVLGHASDLEPLPLEIIPMYFELDGTFPNHEANPLDPKNLVDLQRAVVEHGADIGLAFDGDADRCFVIDEKGQPVTPSAVAAIVARREIAREKASNPGAPITVLHNLLTSNIVREVIEADGARAVRTKVGHSLIKDEMARTNAIFGGEHSAHYYFRDFWGADNGMLAAMHVLAEFGAQDLPLSEFARQYNPYFLSGEINSTVTDVAAAKARVLQAFEGRATVEEFDGITLSSPAQANWWWVNVRASNTEPLLRLNIEAATNDTMAAIRDEVLALIRA
ncbi:MAG: phosphomannomutase/phosphoglucomutase [Rhodoluna sp.]|nr:phosphomannomutase/phosphoglucomutase [Rhodoluna sp.]MBP6186805.1 phosphomannomutase/phosphoglucomutase [Rhodoluna sp.]